MEEIISYPVFKGLQKPLEFMGIRGKFIYYAAGTFLFGFWKSHTNLTHPGKYFRPSKVKIMRPTSPK